MSLKNMEYGINRNAFFQCDSLELAPSAMTLVIIIFKPVTPKNALTILVPYSLE